MATVQTQRIRAQTTLAVQTKPDRAEETRFPTFWMNSCQACHGDLQLCGDDIGHYKKCMNCGRISQDGPAAETYMQLTRKEHTKRSYTDGSPTQSKMNKACPAAPDCLVCPLPSCRYDDPKAYTQEMRNRKTQAATINDR